MRGGPPSGGHRGPHGGHGGNRGPSHGGHGSGRRNFIPPPPPYKPPPPSMQSQLQNHVQRQIQSKVNQQIRNVPLPSGVSQTRIRQSAYNNPIVILLILIFGLAGSIIAALGDNLIIVVMTLIIMTAIAGFLFYKYKKDRVEAAETERMLNTNLESFSETEQDNLLDKYNS